MFGLFLSHPVWSPLRICSGLPGAAQEHTTSGKTQKQGLAPRRWLISTLADVRRQMLTHLACCCSM
jgi:hypothetical protein